MGSFKAGGFSGFGMPSQMGSMGVAPQLGSLGTGGMFGGVSTSGAGCGLGDFANSGNGFGTMVNT